MPLKSSPPAKLGRPYRDLTERLRAAFWALQLRESTGLSFGELDAALVPRPAQAEHQSQDLSARRGRTPSKRKPKKERKTKARIRALDRIARHGDSPENLHRDGLSNVNLVAKAAELYPGSDSDYRADIWKVLSGNRLPSEGARDLLIKLALWRMRLFQGSPALAEFATAICGPRFPGKLGDLQAIRYGAHLLAEQASLDAVLVLALEAYAAVDRLSLIEGQAYVDALKNCCEGYDKRAKAGVFAGLLHGITLSRIVRNKWFVIHPVHWPYTSLLRTRDRAEIDKNPAAHIFEKEEFGPFSQSALKIQEGVPIVLYDERMQWLNVTMRTIWQELETKARAKTGRVNVNEDLLASPSDLLQRAMKLWPE